MCADGGVEEVKDTATLLGAGGDDPPDPFAPPATEAGEEDLDRTAVLQVGDLLIKAHGYGISGDEKVMPLRPFAREHLKLSLDEIEAIVGKMSAEISKAQVAPA